MKLWYQEKYNYDYFKPGFNLYTGHFTQMVWRETEFLGVGVAFKCVYNTLIIINILVIIMTLLIVIPTYGLCAITIHLVM